MLVVTRAVDEVIVIGEPGKPLVLDGPIEIMVTDVYCGKARIGIDLPKSVPIRRLELIDGRSRRKRRRGAA